MKTPLVMTPSAATPSAATRTVRLLVAPVVLALLALAFVLVGCQDTTAVLHVGPDRISAEATGPETVLCAAPEYFFAVFDVRADLVPAGAELGW